ncbi:MAG: hypothetical protein ABIK89_08775, partial [Planctomycetota bacterium]
MPVRKKLLTATIDMGLFLVVVLPSRLIDVLSEPLDDLAFRIPDADLQRHLAWQTMRCTAEARIVGPEGHFHFV